MRACSCRGLVGVLFIDKIVFSSAISLFHSQAHCFISCSKMAFPFRGELEPFTLASLRDVNILQGRFPEQEGEEGLRRALQGNSVDSKRIGYACRYDVSKPEAFVVRPVVTEQMELVNAAFVAMFLCPRMEQLPVDQWYLQAEELSVPDGDLEIIPEQISRQDMLKSGNWAIWWALKHHCFDEINQDFLLWSRLNAMVSVFEGASDRVVAVTVGPGDGVSLDDPRLVSLRRNVRRRR